MRNTLKENKSIYTFDRGRNILILIIDNGLVAKRGNLLKLIFT